MAEDESSSPTGEGSSESQSSSDGGSEQSDTKVEKYIQNEDYVEKRVGHRSPPDADRPGKPQGLSGSGEQGGSEGNSSSSGDGGDGSESGDS